MTIAKKCKYIGINITKDVKDLHNKNHQSLRKEVKEDTNIGKSFMSLHWKKSLK